MINDSARRAVLHSGRCVPWRRCRRAFTLIELLVVIGIMVALSAIMLAFLPKRESKLAADGAAMLQAWLGNARSRAVRDQAPTGLRLLPAAQPAGAFASAQLIQTPEPFTWPAVQITVAAPTTQVPNPPVVFSSTTPGTRVPFDLSAPANNPVVRSGDFLEITYGIGSIHRITNVVYNPITGQNIVTLASHPPSAAITQLVTTNWRIIRQPQPLMGEPALELPNTVIIYPNSASAGAPGSLWLPAANGAGAVDIIFAPSGQVINGVSGQLVLWVWDQNQVSQPTLLSIYANTGFVAAHPVAPGNNPYAFTQDGQSSGN